MEKTLLVLAAGMGSRYGGLKQLDPVGPSGEVVLDYAVHDAIAAGFDRVVFVVRRDFEEAFRRLVDSRYSKWIETDIVFQDIGDMPDGFSAPPSRIKPWGTGHAIWCARKAIKGPFLVVNADDFYGREAFSLMADFLERTKGQRNLQVGMVAYSLGNTLSDHGTVSRGICTLGPDGLLAGVEEYTGIQRRNGVIDGTAPNGSRREFTGKEPASMNFWGFNTGIFPILEQRFCDFLNSGGMEDPKSEYYIPSAVDSLVASDGAKVPVLFCGARWFGVTYRQDRPIVGETLRQMVKDGIYPSPLFGATSHEQPDFQHHGRFSDAHV